jgi:6-phosphogluconolactonase
MDNDKIKIYDTPEIAAIALSEELMNLSNKNGKDFFLSISGGNTPKILFNKLVEPPYNNGINWNSTQIFWCDERCVPPDSSESNFGMTKKYLLDHIPIPKENIHRIKGEIDSSKEAVNYAEYLEKVLCKGNNCIPEFDWILLGLGEDGHTASLFPDKKFLFLYSNIVCVTKHPVTGQKRISLTKEVINNAKKVTFFVTGKEKSKIISEIIFGLPISKNYPASEIKPAKCKVEWIIDKKAAFYLM